MWARRILRAGWLVAPVFAIPSWIKKTLFNDWAQTRFTMICMACLGGVSACTHNMWKLEEPATPERIVAERTGHSPMAQCMRQLMPRRQAQFNRPLTNRDMNRGHNDCEEALEAATIMETQKAALATK